MHFTYSTFLVLTIPFLSVTCFGPISYSLRNLNLPVNCTVLLLFANRIFVLESD